MIKLINISKKYHNQEVLKNVNLELSNGFVVIKGNSGSGKTTLLNLISSFDDDYEGDIFFDDVNYKNIKDKEEFRKSNLGFVFQNPILFNDLTVLDNICYDLNQDIVNKNKINLLLKQVKLNIPLDKKVKYLSGGEKQRLSIVRAIFHDVNILICDEPTGALDENNKELVLKILKEISKTKLVIVVTHEERISKYADIIYQLNNKTITKLYSKKFKLKNIEMKSRKDKLKYNVMFNYIFKSIKGKKIQSFISLFVIALGLFSIGISSLISNVTQANIEQELMSSFSTKKYIIEEKNQHESDFNEIYAVNKETSQSIYLENNCFEYMGVYYLENFNNLFINNNFFELNINEVKYPFSELNGDSINDYHILENEQVYPKQPENLANNEVVLSLRNKDIRRICQNLQLKDYSIESLSNYLLYNSLSLIFNASNDSWSYSYQMDLKCRYFILGSELEIYHSNYAWNEYVFEKEMQLQPINDLLATSYLPWTIKKIYYLKVNLDDRISILRKLLLNKKYNNYYFDYLDSYKKDNKYKERLFVTTQTKRRFDYSYLYNMLDKNSYFFTNNTTYYVHNKLLVNGFINPTFLFDSEQKAISLIDELYISENDIISTSLEGDFICGSMGNITEKNTLKFSIDKESYLIGRKNFSYQEIVVSKGIIKKLFNDDNYSQYLNKDIYFMSLLSSYLEKEIYHNTFSYIKIKIVGIVDNDDLLIYGDELWTSLFYVDNFYYSFSEVESSLCIVEKEYDLNFKYNLIDPYKDIIESLNEVLYYVETGLNVFSLIAIICAILMNGIIFYLFIEEKKKEIALMKTLGIKNSEIKTIFILFSFVLGGLSFLYSIIILILTNIILSLELSSSLILVSFNTLLSITKDILFISFFISLIIGYITSLYCVKSNILQTIKDK